jgi:hypothetical protein
MSSDSQNKWILIITSITAVMVVVIFGIMIWIAVKSNSIFTTVQDSLQNLQNIRSIIPDNLKNLEKIGSIIPDNLKAAGRNLFA